MQDYITKNCNATHRQMTQHCKDLNLRESEDSTLIRKAMIHVVSVIDARTHKDTAATFIEAREIFSRFIAVEKSDEVDRLEILMDTRVGQLEILMKAIAGYSVEFGEAFKASPIYEKCLKEPWDFRKHEEQVSEAVKSFLEGTWTHDSRAKVTTTIEFIFKKLYLVANIAALAKWIYILVFSAEIIGITEIAGIARIAIVLFLLDIKWKFSPHNILLTLGKSITFSKLPNIIGMFITGIGIILFISTLYGDKSIVSFSKDHFSEGDFNNFELLRQHLSSALTALVFELGLGEIVVKFLKTITEIMNWSRNNKHAAGGLFVLAVVGCYAYSIGYNMTFLLQHISLNYPGFTLFLSNAFIFIKEYFSEYIKIMKNIADTIFTPISEYGVTEYYEPIRNKWA